MALVALLLVAAPYPQALADRIIGGAMRDGVAYSRLADLTDSVGPRLSGSPGAEAAVAWALRKFQEDGVAAHPEPVTVPHWVRGEERAELLPAPGVAGLKLAITALGGSPGTPEGGVEAEVVEVASVAEAQALGARAKGKIVFFNHAMSTPSGPTGYGALVDRRSHGPAEAAKLGAVGAFVRSLATASFRSPHTGATDFAEGEPKVPAAAISVEDAELLHRLLAKSAKVRVHLWLGCKTLPDAQSANVVAEVRGREKPDEVVLLGAHLDSWDLAQGAIDDGAGAVIVMEATPLAAQLRPPPRRTIRVVLYMNEENGHAGGKAYAKAHEGEAARHVAALESDSGAGRPVGIVLRAGGNGKALLQPWLPPLERFGAASFVAGEAGGADISPLGRLQVPFVSVRQDNAHYFDLHHSAADTFDHVDRDDLSRQAAAVSWVAVALAEMEGTLARPPPTPPRASEKKAPDQPQPAAAGSAKRQ
ncbi:MAG: M28 family peptidase [Myxococcales bacterium]